MQIKTFAKVLSKLVEYEEHWDLVTSEMAPTHSEKTLIWLLLKQHLPKLYLANINPIEFLIWTQVKNVGWKRMYPGYISYKMKIVLIFYQEINRIVENG